MRRVKDKKKYTIADIAREAGVSKTTVSFFLNGKTHKMSEETRERIAEVVERLQYRPSLTARMLGADQTHLIGVVIGDITNGFSNQLVKGIDSVCRQNGYQIIVGSSDYEGEEEAQHIGRLLDMNVDGLIVQPTVHFSGAQVLGGPPTVFVDSRPDGDCDWVRTNNYEASHAAITDCVERGYDRFLMFTAALEHMIPRVERMNGCVHALGEKGIDCRIKVIGADTPDEEILKVVRGQIRPDGRLLVFVTSCWLLSKVFLAIAPLRGEMPEQLGLLGFDSTEWCDLSVPTVSTIVQPTFEAGVTAARLLLSRIEGGAESPADVILPCETFWRAST